MRSVSIYAAALTAVMLTVLTTGVPVSAAPDDPSIDFEAFPSHPTEASQATSDLAEELSSLVDESPDKLTGVVIDGKGRIVITVGKNADTALLEGLASQRSAQYKQKLLTRPEGKQAAQEISSITVQSVGRSRSDMEKIRSELQARRKAGEFGHAITGLGLDTAHGRVNVYATEDSGQIRTALKRQYGDAIVFRKSPALHFLSGGRSDDQRPHYGGAGITSRNTAGNAGGRCSAAFAYSISNITYEVTAGHCYPGSSPYNWGWAVNATPGISPINYSFGNLRTTTVGGTLSSPTSGTADVYGDWALLQSSTYDGKIYNCANLQGTCTSLYIGTAQYGDPAVGTGVCFSGVMSGQVCRFHVVDADVTFVVEAPNGTWIDIAQVAMTKRDDGNCGEVYLQPGDSGGSVYQAIAGRPGYERAMGIVTGGGDLEHGNECEVGYTKIKGIRAWAPGSSVVIYV